MSFNVIIVIIVLGGWLLSRLFKIIKLPSVLGMMVCGIIVSAFWKDLVPEQLWQIEPFLKSLALIIILLRAGLGISRETLQKVGITALLMAIIPCLIEGTALMLAIHFVFHFNWIVSGLTAFMLAAVSPAVIVPSMLNLKEQGYGKDKEVPTIVLAGASVDDVLAITLFSLFLGMATSSGTGIARSLLNLPLSLGAGIIPGIAAGFFLVWLFKKQAGRLRATEKALILLTLAMLLVETGSWLHSAALLGVMTVGFIILERAEKVAHELSAKLAKAWIFAEIILFVLIGISVDIPTALNAGLKGLGVLCFGLIFRSAGVLIATSFTRGENKLTIKERLFCVIAYLPKATVQAALGSVALAHGLPEGKVILALAVLAILFTAPLGLLGINVFGPKLLKLSETKS